MTAFMPQAMPTMMQQQNQFGLPTGQQQHEASNSFHQHSQAAKAGVSSMQAQLPNYNKEHMMGVSQQQHRQQQHISITTSRER